MFLHMLVIALFVILRDERSINCLLSINNRERGCHMHVCIYHTNCSTAMGDWASSIFTIAISAILWTIRSAKRKESELFWQCLLVLYFIHGTFQAHSQLQQESPLQDLQILKVVVYIMSSLWTLIIWSQYQVLVSSKKRSLSHTFSIFLSGLHTSFRFNTNGKWTCMHLCMYVHVKY